ncbi:MAG: hypothetical protein PHN69_04360 [Candidatus Pacebacteria bacterium]|nr:hypothetical protein [Candidatus Paceibacterota bacterium]
MFFNNTENKLTKIRIITDNALSFFYKILNDLEDANVKLQKIIHIEDDKVTLHEININEAECQIKENFHIINKLKAFLHED